MHACVIIVQETLQISVFHLRVDNAQSHDAHLLKKLPQALRTGNLHYICTRTGIQECIWQTFLHAGVLHSLCSLPQGTPNCYSSSSPHSSQPSLSRRYVCTTAALMCGEMLILELANKCLCTCTYCSVTSKRPWTIGKHGPKLVVGAYMERPSACIKYIDIDLKNRGWVVTQRKVFTWDNTLHVPAKAIVVPDRPPHMTMHVCNRGS